MRTSMMLTEMSKYKLIVVDDEIAVINSLKSYLHNYTVVGVTNPLDAIEIIKNEHFDLMLLDYTISPFNGDEIIDRIREINKDLYILLLAEHNDLVQQIENIRKLDIQGYCEKGDNFGQLLLLIESGLKSIEQMDLIKRMNKELSDSKELLERSYLESIETLRNTVEVKDIYTKGHSDRVAEYSLLIGEKLNLPDDEMKTLKIGAMFHDIGKIGIPDGILLKNDSLTTDEYNEIKKHPSIGSHIISNASIFSDIIPIVKYHHENYDGTGYPSHLSGSDIPLLARIVAVADTFDAMTSRRSYRDALDFDSTKHEIEACSGTQFDPMVADTFINILETEKDKILDIQKKGGGFIG